MLGMCITHSIASGIGGVRTAGDLVARMQMARGMKTPEAKKYVADKLKISVRDLTDSTVMTNVRTELGLGCVAQLPNHPKGMEAKFNIAELLGIEINSVNKFKERAKMFVPASA
jgi:dimethylamine--corrinoid protein Co-methyltransferase